MDIAASAFAAPVIAQVTPQVISSDRITTHDEWDRYERAAWARAFREHGLRVETSVPRHALPIELRINAFIARIACYQDSVYSACKERRPKTA